MITVSLEEAQSDLPELLNRLRPGEECMIIAQGRAVAQVRKIERDSWPSKAGSYQKPGFSMSADFDAPLAEFRDYM